MLLAQPGYIALLRNDLTRRIKQINEPVAETLCSPPPSPARWRFALDKAARILQAVSEQMETYSDGQSLLWHQGASADRFHEILEQVNELQAQLDDLRSDF
jgi:hypothetical protein